jgi:hypothetical protein
MQASLAQKAAIAGQAVVSAKPRQASAARAAVVVRAQKEESVGAAACWTHPPGPRWQCAISSLSGRPRHRTPLSPRPPPVCAGRRPPCCPGPAGRRCRREHRPALRGCLRRRRPRVRRQGHQQVRCVPGHCRGRGRANAGPAIRAPPHPPRRRSAARARLLLLLTRPPPWLPPPCAGFVPYAGEGFALLLPSRWNPSREQDFPGVVLR